MHPEVEQQYPGLLDLTISQLHYGSVVINAAGGARYSSATITITITLTMTIFPITITVVINAAGGARYSAATVELPIVEESRRRKSNSISHLICNGSSQSAETDERLAHACVPPQPPVLRMTYCYYYKYATTTTAINHYNNDRYE